MKPSLLSSKLILRFLPQKPSNICTFLNGTLEPLSHSILSSVKEDKHPTPMGEASLELAVDKRN